MVNVATTDKTQESRERLLENMKKREAFLRKELRECRKRAKKLAKHWDLKGKEKK